MHLMPHEAGQDMIDVSLFLCAYRVLAQNNLKVTCLFVPKYLNLALKIDIDKIQNIRGNLQENILFHI